MGAMYGVVGKVGAGKTTFLTALAQKSLQGKSFMGLPAKLSKYLYHFGRKIHFQVIGAPKI